MNIGLIAHNSKKKLMQNFCIAYRNILSKNTLYATGTTGRLIEEASNLTVHKFLAGHLGGEQQLGALIEQNEMDLVIYLREPLAPQKHDPDVKRIFHLCDTHNRYSQYSPGNQSGYSGDDDPLFGKRRDGLA